MSVWKKISDIIKVNCNVDIISETLRSMESIIDRQAADVNSGTTLLRLRFCLHCLAVVKTAAAAFF